MSTDATQDSSADSRRTRVEETLQRFWGHPTLREGQWPIIADVLEGRDVLGVLPTGGGKSVCYQLPAVLDEGMTLVISPLVALMADQVAGLRSRSIEATFLNSTLGVRSREQRWDDLLAGRHRMLYVAPERLLGERFRARAPRLGITRIAVDEAHCVSEWGHDFRPDYLRIPETRQALGNPPILAVTATATPPVRADIIRLLGLQKPAVHVHGFDRPNLTWTVFRGGDKQQRLGDVLAGVQGAGIVYTSSRRGAESWARYLERQGVAVSVYHAGLSAEDRWGAQEAWMQGATRVMVATTAFGMGIDRRDVRFVVHVDLPHSVDAYYQAAGRAGRDGLAAHAVLLQAHGDREATRDRIKSEHPGARQLKTVFELACSMASIAVGSSSLAPFAIDIDRISNIAGLPPGRVRRAVDLLERQGLWRKVRGRADHGLIRVATTLDRFQETVTARLDPGLEALATGLMRRLPQEAWKDWAPFDMRANARQLDLDPARLQAGLDNLAALSLLEWQRPDLTTRYELTDPRPARPRIDSAKLRVSRRRASQRYDDLIRYVDAVGCRRRAILGYFGQSAPARCGRCDYCTGRHEPIVVTPADEKCIRSMLRSVAEGHLAEDAPDAGHLPAWHRRALADWLVQQGYLAPDDETGGDPLLTEEGKRFVSAKVPSRH